jgi:hypothetical protein
VVLVSPAPGATLPPSFKVMAQASDNIGVVAVALALDGKLVDVDTERPFEFTLDQIPPGPVTLEVRARDAAGNEGTDAYAVTISEGAQASGPDDGGCRVSSATLRANDLTLLALLILGLLCRRRRA